MSGSVNFQSGMVSQDRVEDLVQLLVEERRLIERARVVSPDWQELLHTEAELRQRLEVLLAQPVSVQEVEAVRIALQEMLTLNSTFIDLIEGHRARAVQALEHKALVRRAATAYSQSAVG